MVWTRGARFPLGAAGKPPEMSAVWVQASGAVVGAAAYAGEGSGRRLEKRKAKPTRMENHALARLTRPFMDEAL